MHLFSSSELIEPYFKFKDIFAQTNLFDDEHFRDHLVSLMAKVLTKLTNQTQSCCLSDNVSALKLIIKILDQLMFPTGLIKISKRMDTLFLDEYAVENIVSFNDSISSSSSDILNQFIYQTMDKKRTFIPLVHTSRLSQYNYVSL